MKKRLVNKFTSVFLVISTFVSVVAPNSTFGAIAKNVNVYGIDYAISNEYYSNATDNIKLSFFEGVTINLQYYDETTREWLTESVIKPKSNNVTIEYPSLWKKHLITYWRILIPKTSITNSYVSDRITLILKNYNKPSLDALEYTIIDSSSKKTIASKYGKDPRPMASTTKLMTALLVFENCEMNDIVTITKASTKVPYSSLDLRVGEKYYVKTLLRAMLLPSANDAANALAIYVAGSEKAFVQMMNNKAKQLGLDDTSYKCSYGLDYNGHQSSPYDIAFIHSYLLQNYPVFAKIEQKRVSIIQTISGQRVRKLKTTNLLMGKQKYLISGKTGQTTNAGYCYSGAIKYHGKTYVFTLLKNSKIDCRWSDIKKVVRYIKKYA